MYDESYATTRCLTAVKPSVFESTVKSKDTYLKTPNSTQKIAEGGLRLQGFFKESSVNKPLITVVTVVFNDEGCLEDTIRSVIEQDYSNVEYIVVDGGSKDGTLDIIRKYENVIDYWVSEPDKGIYYAMNKALYLGSGKWINFMNAGDAFATKAILSLVVREMEIGIDLIYGDYGILRDGAIQYKKVGKPKDLWKGAFCHQSLLSSSELYKKIEFDTSYKICGDTGFLLTALKSNISIKKIDLSMANISPGGLSDLSRVESVKEQFDLTFKKSGVPKSKIVGYFSYLYLKNLIKVLLRMIGLTNR